MCEACRGGVRGLREPLCPRCGREVEQSRPDCGCRRRLRALSKIRSAAVYEGPLERALHRFKYEGWRALAPALAGILSERLQAPAGARVAAVPLHRRRQRERGYNQSALLARELARNWALTEAPRGLVRVRNTQPQVGLDRLRRRDNMEDAFSWQGRPLTGAFVLLVDDVATTGSTLEACARALKAGGAARVEAVTVARAMF